MHKLDNQYKETENKFDEWRETAEYVKEQRRIAEKEKESQENSDSGETPEKSGGFWQHLASIPTPF